jgi:hypothetical protein
LKSGFPAPLTLSIEAVPGTAKGHEELDLNGRYMVPYKSVKILYTGDGVINPPTYEAGATHHKYCESEVNAIATTICEADGGFCSVGWWRGGTLRVSA